VSALSLVWSFSLLRALDDSWGFQFNITMLAGQTDGMNKNAISIRQKLNQILT
jgi:hypothetical protein